MVGTDALSGYRVGGTEKSKRSINDHTCSGRPPLFTFEAPARTARDREIFARERWNGTAGEREAKR